MPKLKSPLTLFFIILLGILALALLGPEEQSLGANVRIVYLHGAWVLTAEIALLAAAAAGLVGWIARKASLHQWSAALGRTGMIFWISYLPLSMWAMQSNWNGLFLAEPRFRLALIFAISGLLLQIGLWILNMETITSAANLIFFVALRLVFSTASNIMHPPPSPIFSSGNNLIIGFFVVLNVLTWVAAFFLSLWLLGLARQKPSGDVSPT